MAGMRGATRATCARWRRSAPRASRRASRLRGRATRKTRRAPAPTSSPACAASSAGGTVGSASTPGQRRISPTDSGVAPGAPRVTSAAAFASCSTRARSTARPAAPAAGRASVMRHSTLPRFSSARIRSRSVGFEAAQFVGEAKLEVEEPVVDGTQFDGQRHAGQFRGNCREAGHAADHRPNRSESGNFSGFTLGAFIRRMYALSAAGASSRAPAGMRIASALRGLPPNLSPCPSPIRPSPAGISC